MKRILYVLTIFIVGLAGSYGQEKPEAATPKIQDAKSQMVLRGTTRDQVYMVKDNLHRKKIQKRKQVAINRQQMLMKKRQMQIQTNKVRMQQRNLRQRRVKQQVVRRQQIRRRK